VNILLPHCILDGSSVSILTHQCREFVKSVPAGGGRGLKFFSIAVMLIKVTVRKFFIHLRHCVTPPPAEDTLHASRNDPRQRRIGTK